MKSLEILPFFDDFKGRFSQLICLNLINPFLSNVSLLYPLLYLWFSDVFKGGGGYRSWTLFENGLILEAKFGDDTLEGFNSHILVS